MLDPELQHYLSGISQHLVDLKAKKGPGVIRSFFNGVFSALGYIVGLLLIILFLGWILNRLGLLDQFKQQLSTFTDLANSAKKLIPQDQNFNNLNPGANGGESTITLPDGRQVKVQIPAK